MEFQVTVRYGARYQRHHTYRVEAGNVVSALRRAADEMPDEIVEEADLVELRPAPDAEAREYVGESS